MAEPCDLPAVTARQAIISRALSPVELVESCIARIEAVDPAVNAMIARDFEGALAEAREKEAAIMRGDPLGPLHGLPLAVKDLIDVEGLPTTFGSPLFAANRATKDEAVVGMLRRAGAIVIGKTNTPEWGAGGNTRNAVHGATGNPFDPALSAAGSSGGSAVAVATGMVPLATGSDTGGSLRNPAAFNGIVGYRPSPGLVASDSRNMSWIQLAQLGPMARNVADAGLMASCMMQRSAADSISVIAHEGPVEAALFADPPPVDLRRLRLALSADLGFAPTENAIRTVFAAKCARLAQEVGSIEEAHPDCRNADEAFGILRGVMFLGWHRELAERHPDQVGPNIHLQIAEGLRYTAADVARALSMQTAMYRSWQGFFERYDLLVTPAITISPRVWRELYPAEIDGTPTQTYYQWLALAYAVTLTGHPAIAIPVGRDHAGMPFGIQIVGPRGGDLKVLAAARALEAVFAGSEETARPEPDIEWLKAQPPLAMSEGFRAFD
ncbi:MAG: amidase family protein [Beijerinckiaceae bacterium]|nr:amidase family protein [Beijerinckiaceae bacterium]MCZ8300711.1 amidase family protein [Beijerinckiaceae bacterium]